jgi:anti-sigma B factor antagonist
MKVNYTEVNGVTIVELEGRIMLGDGSSIELRDSIRDLLAKGRKNILLNLAGITYIGTAAVGELINAYQHAQKLDGDVKLLKLGARVDNMLQITKLYRVFDIFDDARTAIAAFVINQARTFPNPSYPPEDDSTEGPSSPVPG